MIRVFKRDSKEVVAEYADKNVKFAPTEESLEEMRKIDGEVYFIIELKGMRASMAWWPVKEYDFARV